MKKTINKIVVIALALLTFSCSDPENPIYDVFDGLSYGAVIRTLERGSQNFNAFDTSSSWDITVEVQDEKKGELFSDVKVYASYKDIKDDGVDNNRAETLVATIPASEFTTGDNGLPTKKLEYTLSELLTALSLSDGQYAGGDTFTMRLELNLSDGRSFSAADGSGSLQGSYFQSPYSYQIGMLCIPATPFTGDYKIDMVDSFGDGWNGAAITATIDGTSTDYTISSGATASHTINVPDGTQTLVFTFVSGAWDGEASFKIYAPSGNLIADVAAPPTAGPIALNLCNETAD